MQARIARPRAGNWVAEVVVDAAVASQLPQGAAASLVTDGGALTFAGTILRADSYAANITLRMVGGSNRLSNAAKPRFYAGVQVQQPLQDVLGDAGYSLSPTSMPSALQFHIAFWAMVHQPVSEALSSLAQAVGPDVVWRVLNDGTVFFGQDQFLASALTNYQLIDYMPLEGIQVISSETPDVNPGESFNGRNVSKVEHVITPDASRIRLWYDS